MITMQRKKADTHGGQQTHRTPVAVQKNTNSLLRLLQRGDLRQEHILAAWDIARTFQTITADVQVKVSRPDRLVVQGGQFAQPREFGHEVVLKQAYGKWTQVLQKEGMLLSPLLEMIVEERPLSQIDREWRRRKGWAKEHLYQGLEHYCQLRRAMNGRSRQQREVQ